MVKIFVMMDADGFVGLIHAYDMTEARSAADQTADYFWSKSLIGLSRRQRENAVRPAPTWTVTEF